MASCQRSVDEKNKHLSKPSKSKHFCFGEIDPNVYTSHSHITHACLIIGPRWSGTLAVCLHGRKKRGTRSKTAQCLIRSRLDQWESPVTRVHNNNLEGRHPQQVRPTRLKETGWRQQHRKLHNPDMSFFTSCVHIFLSYKTIDARLNQVKCTVQIAWWIHLLCTYRAIFRYEN